MSSNPRHRPYDSCENATEPIISSASLARWLKLKNIITYSDSIKFIALYTFFCWQWILFLGFGVLQTGGVEGLDALAQLLLTFLLNDICIFFLFCF